MHSRPLFGVESHLDYKQVPRNQTSISQESFDIKQSDILAFMEAGELKDGEILSLIAELVQSVDDKSQTMFIHPKILEFLLKFLFKDEKHEQGSESDAREKNEKAYQANIDICHRLLQLNGGVFDEILTIKDREQIFYRMIEESVSSSYFYNAIYILSSWAHSDDQKKADLIYDLILRLFNSVSEDSEYFQTVVIGCTFILSHISDYIDLTSFCGTLIDMVIKESMHMGVLTRCISNLMQFDSTIAEKTLNRSFLSLAVTKLLRDGSEYNVRSAIYYIQCSFKALQVEQVLMIATYIVWPDIENILRTGTEDTKKEIARISKKLYMLKDPKTQTEMENSGLFNQMLCLVVDSNHNLGEYVGLCLSKMVTYGMDTSTVSTLIDSGLMSTICFIIPTIGTDIIVEYLFALQTCLEALETAEKYKLISRFQQIELLGVYDYLIDMIENASDEDVPYYESTLQSYLKISKIVENYVLSDSNLQKK